MENVLTKEQLLEFIRKNNIQSVSDIYESLKDLFKDVLQSFLEAEIEETLDYEKYDVKNKQTTNSRNGYTQKFENFCQIKEKWGKQYPYAFRSWESNWDLLTSFFKFPPEIRKIIYTTNIIEGIHRQFRKVTKSKSVFPNDTALEKILYLATKNVVRK